MTDKPKKFKNNMILIAFGVLLFWGVNNYTIVLGLLSSILSLIMPFIIGMCIAFILNVPMKAIEKRLFPNRPNSSPTRQRIQRKLKRPISLILTLIIILGALFLVSFLVIPELVNTLNTLKNNFPGFIKRINVLINDISKEYPQIQEWFSQNISKFIGSWDKILNTIMEYISNGASNLLSFATSIFNGLFNALLGIIFAIYLLSQKETLEAQTRKIVGVYIPKKTAERTIYICSKANNTFSNFLGGQCTEAFILGTLCFIGMSILRFPYALVISILISFTAFIPIVGAFIGTAVGAFLILVTDPMQALWFIVFILILQQVEGNLIYPKVVGSSVGLPPMWVLLAVTVGGGLMGILGMFMSVPICSVLYCLIKEAVDAKSTANRGINNEGGDSQPTSASVPNEPPNTHISGENNNSHTDNHTPS